MLPAAGTYTVRFELPHGLQHGHGPVKPSTGREASNTDYVIGALSMGVSESVIKGREAGNVKEMVTKWRQCQELYSITLLINTELSMKLFNFANNYKPFNM